MTAQFAPSSTLSAQDMRSVADTHADLAAELGRVLAGAVRFDGFTRMLYSTDASLFQIMPVGVVIPKHADDVQATVEGDRVVRLEEWNYENQALVERDKYVPSGVRVDRSKITAGDLDSADVGAEVS